MIKLAYNEEETVWMKLKLPKLGFLSDLPNLEPISHYDVRWSRRDVGKEPRPRRDMVHLDPGHVAMCGCLCHDDAECSIQVSQ